MRSAEHQPLSCKYLRDASRDDNLKSGKSSVDGCSTLSAVVEDFSVFLWYAACFVFESVFLINEKKIHIELLTTLAGKLFL
jgi:hypothetical protein